MPWSTRAAGRAKIFMPRVACITQARSRRGRTDAEGGSSSTFADGARLLPGSHARGGDGGGACTLVGLVLDAVKVRELDQELAGRGITGIDPGDHQGRVAVRHCRQPLHGAGHVGASDWRQWVRAHDFEPIQVASKDLKDVRHIRA